MEETEYLEREAGKFNSVVVPISTLRIAKSEPNPETRFRDHCH